ncbi:MAG: hypothetical protein ACF8XB_21820 [Planctomycetota bacterium JB042]
MATIDRPTGRAPAIAALVLAALAGPAVAAPEEEGAGTLPADPAAPPFRTRVNRAIDRGVVALLRQQELDGSWRSNAEAYGGGMTALAVLTLVKCGLESDHPALRRALRFLTTRPDPVKTYSMATTILALCATDPEAEEARIERLTGTLLGWQRGGGFGYPDYDRDLSNTQYAALALRAAAGAGVKIPRKVWEGLAEWTLGHQEEARGAYAPAGFRYLEGKDATGSMTAAGVSVLAIAAEGMGRRGRQALEVGRARGLKWLETHFSATTNPHPRFAGPGRDDEDAHHYYHLYGVERVAALHGLDRIGEHDWYREGAEYLLGRQGDRGDWDRHQPNTCFALLFLSKATAPTSGSGGRLTRAYGTVDPGADVSLLASGDTPLTLWVGGFGDDARADLEWPGEEGRGPRVVRVEYVDAGGEVLAAVDGDPGRPSGVERHAVRHAFDRNGVRSLTARVTCVRPGGDPTADGDRRILESAPLEVPILAVDDPTLRRYVDDRDRDRIDPADAAWSSSSERPGHETELAFDGVHGTSWRSAEDDRAPWLRVEFERGVRATALLLGPYVDREDLGRGPPPPIRVAVRVNRRDPTEVPLDPASDRKTVVPLERGARVRTLEVRAVELADEAARRTFGFSEVELVDDR